MAKQTASVPAPARRRLSWNDPATRALFYQVVVVGIVGFVVWYLVSNTLHNLSVRNISTGFGFLQREAGFAIGESPIAYTPADTYGRAVWVGLLNTLRVSIVGIVLATLLGTLIGIARLSKNWLVSGVASVYVEVMRNIPLLLQLFFWYAIITENMPGPRQALEPVPGVFISNRGLLLPSLQGDALDWILGDRKSTRLNSSHVRISYAVFCLKKKHKKQIATSSCTCTAPGSKHAARVVKARLAPALRVSPLLA